MTDAGGGPSQIGGNADPCSAAGPRDCDRNRVYCVVQGEEGVHPELADREAAASFIEAELLGSIEEWGTCLTRGSGEIDLSSDLREKTPLPRVWSDGHA